MTTAARAQEKEGAEQLLVLSFTVNSPNGQIHCGVNIHKVREVIEMSHLSPLPKEYEPFVAVHDLRGMPIPVMPLEHVFNRAAKAALTEHGRILVIELQKKVIGLLVASTGRIRSFRNSEVLKPPAALEQVKSQFFNGVIKGEKDYLYLLDIEAILDSFGISLDRENRGPATRPAFEGKRVLVVEDSRLYQKKISNVFAAWGCVLEFAQDGKEALETLRKKDYAFDLIFSDIEMPVMNGIELALQLKATPEASRIPIIFNSSLSNPMLIEEIKERALGGYIVKFDEEAIREEISKVL